MDSNDFYLLKAKEAGFNCLDDFVRANLHYLSKDRHELFYSVCDKDYNGDYRG